MERAAAEQGAVRQKPDYFGCLMGLAVFGGGLALLLVTFGLAYKMFSVPVSEALNLPLNQPVNLEIAGQSFAGLVIRVLLLLVMSITGSIFANKGIKLYLAGRQEMFEAQSRSES